MRQMKIRITYDGRVNISPHSIGLGDYSIVDVVNKALGIGDDKYQMINAEVEIFINRKEDTPLVLVEEDDEC